MSWSQALLLLAILVVFLLWRRARGQVARVRREIDQHRERNTFTFEAARDGRRRFVVRDPAGGEVAPESLTWSEHGLEAVTALPAPDDAADPDPGEPVELVEEEDGVTVWNRDMTRRLATIPGTAAGVVRRRLEEGELGGCIVLGAPADSDGRLSLLLIHAAVDVDLED